MLIKISLLNRKQLDDIPFKTILFCLLQVSDLSTFIYNDYDF